LKLLEKIANIAVILAAIVFIAVVVRSELSKHSHPAYPASIARDMSGKTVTLPGVNFPKQTKTLLIAISTSCHFCKESLPFYKDLSEKLKGKVDVIAVLPQSEEEAKTFIQGANISVNQVVSTELVVCLINRVA